MKLFTLSQDPRFDGLRDTGEFREVVQHLGLAPGIPANGLRLIAH